MDTATAQLEAELRDLLGTDAVSSDLHKREKASADGSYLSPIIQAQLPLGTAELVAYPASAAEIAATVAAAARHGVAVTPGAREPATTGSRSPCAAGWSST